MPNFIEIGQTSLEKSVKKRYLFGPSRHFFVTDGQKRDYLSRASQRARGATKNEILPPISRYIPHITGQYVMLPHNMETICGFTPPYALTTRGTGSLYLDSDRNANFNIISLIT